MASRYVPIVRPSGRVAASPPAVSPMHSRLSYDPTTNVNALVAALASLTHMRWLLAPGASAWEDQIGSEDVTPFGTASYAAGEATFGANGYFETAGVPAWGTGFGGPALTDGTVDNEGITLFLLAKTTSWANKVIWQADMPDPPNNGGYLWRTNANSELEFWMRKGTDRVSPYWGVTRATIPPDRMNYYKQIGSGTSRLNLAPYADNKYHLYIILRGTTNPPEAKIVQIDLDTVSDGGTGNAVTGHDDMRIAASVGRAYDLSVGITDDVMHENFSGVAKVFGIRSAWTTEKERASVAYAAGGL